MEISELQKLIRDIYFERDSARGMPETFMWLAEEVGELSRALRRCGREEMEGEFADVLAWLLSLASMMDIDMERVTMAKYAHGCPKCGSIPCACSSSARSEA